jgi:YD repeat-containing protein
VTLPNPAGGGSGGPSQSVVYGTLGYVVQQFDELGAETDNTVNWRGQVLTTTGPAPTPCADRPTETFTYNADGQVLTDQNALLATTQYVYDSFGRRTEAILPDPDGGGPLTSPTLHWGYDADSNVTSFVDANGNTYAYVYHPGLFTKKGGVAA